MQDVPQRDVEYTLVRELDSEIHVATFIRYHDDSGTICHGSLRIGFEFNWPSLLNHWQVMRDVGWMTLDDAVSADLVGADVTRSCSSEYCRDSIEPKIIEWLESGMSGREVTKRAKAEGQPFSDWHDKVLWGG